MQHSTWAPKSFIRGDLTFRQAGAGGHDGTSHDGGTLMKTQAARKKPVAVGVLNHMLGGGHRRHEKFLAMHSPHWSRSAAVLGAR